MTELLDAFEDGGVDRDTVAFVVEALSEAEPSDWGVVLEAFLPSEHVLPEALKVLDVCPKVLERTVAVLKAEADAAAAEAAKPPPNADSLFLGVFDLALTSPQANASSLANASSPSVDSTCRASFRSGFPGVLFVVEVSCLGQLAKLCRISRSTVSGQHVWKERVRRTCALWGLMFDEVNDDWRTRFFSLLRPRCDGLYVGQCKYVHHVVPGSSMNTRLMNRNFFWIDYRRYVRLLPPDPEDGSQFALVLRDVATVDEAARALLSVDPRTHVNEREHEGSLHDQKTGTVRPKDAESKLQRRVCAGTYSYDTTSWHIIVRFRIGEDMYEQQFQLFSDQEYETRFSGCLEWIKYETRAGDGQPSPFNLGRSKFGGGVPADNQKDHFPSLFIHPIHRLSHLL